MAMSSWISEAIGTGLASIFGFFAKYGWDYFQAKKQVQKDRIKRLETLKGMLVESGNLFVMQNKLLNRLVSTMTERLKLDSPDSIGFQSFICDHYEQMDEHERDMHSVIRGTTMNSMKIVNTEMLKWLKEDNEFKINSVKYIREKFGEGVADQLNQLELHLNLWHDKYAVWMESEKHCVVYLDDDEKHGVGFPTGIENVIDLCLAELYKHSK